MVRGAEEMSAWEGPLAGLNPGGEVRKRREGGSEPSPSRSAEVQCSGAGLLGKRTQR